MRKFNRHSFLCLMIMLLSVLIITISFSWITRPKDSVSAHSLSLNNTGADDKLTVTIKSEEGVSAFTYKSVLDKGMLNIGEIVVAASDIVIAPGEVQYFTTVVINSSSAKNNISLNDLTITGNVTGANISMLSPIKTTSIYAENMVLAAHLTVDAGATLNVEWYIYNPTDETMTFNFKSLPKVDYYE